MDIILPNGQTVKKIEPTNKQIVTTIKTNKKLQEEEARIRHRIDELPIQDSKMNTISVVLSYYLFGLNTNDISIMTKLPKEQVENIIMLPAFDEMLKKVTKAIVENDTEDVRTFIQKQTKKAATKVMEIMENAAPKYALEAAKDILDRGGHRPVDIVEHVNKMDGELRIIHIKKDEHAVNNIKDVEFEEIK
ncbi:MAG: hypothetical protein IKT40_01175 [Bacilli bacterium]|nr:hypothetical protein [Bacilli bacterium]